MKSPLIKTLIFLGNLLIFGIVFTAVFVGSLSLSLPEVTGISEFNPPIFSQILSRDGDVLLEVGMEKRDLTQISDIPQKVINAFLVAEDKNFYSHRGVDYMGILRAFWANLKAGKVVQGGSTITQQVAKQLYLSGERSIVRKIKDMLLALELEKKFSKDEILYLYLNQVYLGGGYYGVTAAFRGYFEKELDEVTIAECALIAGLLVAPSRYSPYVNPEYAKVRQSYVLTRLLSTNKITEEEYLSAKNEVLKFRIKKSNPPTGEHFTDWIRQIVEKNVGKENFWQNGFKIVTTIDKGLQEKAEKYIREGVKAINKRQGYKGPLKYLRSEEDLRNFLVAQRNDIYKKNSNYFFLKLPKSAITEYELTPTPGELEKIEEYDDTILNISGRYKIYPGNPQDKKDPLWDFIKEGEIYKAVVLHTDNIHKSIYVSIGGIKGIIPYEEFRWAREMVISDERNYIPLVNRASSILKRGDIVLVKILKKNQTIYETMDKSEREKLKKQKKSKEIIRKYKSQKFLKIALDQESDVEGALVAIHPVTGEILSLVGGSNFTKSQYNRAIQSFRQPGSSFKPILYAAALENGFKPNDILIDSPEALRGEDKTLSWKPRNYDGTFKGPITFRRALETSRNIPTIKIASKLGVQKIIDFVKRIGLEVDLQPDLSLALGSMGATLINLTTTYAIFPNGGMRIFPKTILSITDRFGTEYDIQKFEPYRPPPVELLESEDTSTNDFGDKNSHSDNEEKSDKDENKIEENENDQNEDINKFLVGLNNEYVYDKRLAFIMSNLLRGVIQNGTGRKARHVSSFIGGKTGTTNSYVDALFLGFSSNLALGVWTGFDDNKTLGWGETGSKAALPIWKKYMESYLKKYGEYDFKTPSGIINVRINKETGQAHQIGDTNTIMETFILGTEPGSETKEETLPTEDIKNDLLEDGDYFIDQ